VTFAAAAAAAVLRFDLRSEALIMGAHKLPVAGMASATLPHDIGECGWEREQYNVLKRILN
jgi:hypothetical protein